ncbi:MAG: helix-turn-helix domain-containing protein [bacterium]|nr:helix-turn-helix domain-containing protein [bacterium]
MEDSITEAGYPLSFRRNDAVELGKCLKDLNSAVLIGMKRVGINNFLRFFLYNKNIMGEHINDERKHLFISVDLHDLVELEIFPFWTLTLKRIVDAVEQSVLNEKTKNKIENLFLNSIQSKDIFLTMDSVRRSLVKIVENNILPTIFFDRFDRIKDVVTPEFYGNLQGIKDATHQKLTYVFTSFKKLDDLAPKAFAKNSLSVFVKNIYMKPAEKHDAGIIFKTFDDRYKLSLSSKKEKELLDLTGGHIQYLHLIMILLNEKKEELKKGKINFLKEFINDERIVLQSEELWESLNKEEQAVILKISDGQKVSDLERSKAEYLWKTGFISEANMIFSPLFGNYLKEKGRNFLENLEFTKKENLLMGLLKKKINNVCEREEIAEIVWPEAQTFGVSDWAIDRLAARVRSKLKNQEGNYEIVTIKTRGYKLIFS